MAVFPWCWIGLFTVVLLPLGVAMLHGWAPRWGRTLWSPARTRVQGASALVLYLGGLVTEAFSLPNSASRWVR